MTVRDSEEPPDTLKDDFGATALRLRAAVESSPSGLLMTSGDGTIVLVNREIERLFGYAREELLGKGVDMLVPERLRKGHHTFRAKFLGDLRVRPMGAGRDLFALCKDGSEVPVEIVITPVATDDGLFVLSSIVDISERKRAEVQFRAAVESSPSGMLMVDSTGSIVLVNREIERMFGYPREELLGKSVELLVPQRFRGGHPALRRAYFAEPHHGAMRIGRDLLGLRRDGTEFPVQIGLNAINAEDGLFVLSSVVDVSAIKRGEDQQHRLEEQLLQAQKMEAVGTLAGGIAHDFNNILSAIVGYAELAQLEMSGNQRASADLNELLNTANRAKDLIERILTFSRPHKPDRRPLGLEQVIEELLPLFQATIPPNIDVTPRVAKDSPRVSADSTYVHQVLMNLVTNAAHAMPGGGELEVAVDSVYVRDGMARAHPGLREGQYAVLSVRDTGAGIDPAIADRVFEPFFTTKPPGSGSGLGLAMVHGIMRDHEGAVLMESKPGIGTTVRCFFPAISSGEVDTTQSKPAAPRGNGERILYIDDEPTLAQLGKRRLTNLGYEVETALDGEQALTWLRDHSTQIDLVVTDYLMPGITGLELANEIQSIRPNTRVVLLTGFIEDIPPEDLEAAGIRSVVTKPATTVELAFALREALADA